MRHRAKFRGDRSNKPLQRYGDFQILQHVMAAAAILDF